MAAEKTLNRLSEETSPYLVMHAEDPVDWFPWGPEAFELARSEDKPIFLSSGYASCHWCHVMQRESFRDAETAEILNERFVSIKVDREERPDVDALYMEYVVATTGSGGWPMSVFLTPELLPIFGGTYFPRRAPAHGGTRIPAFTEVLERVYETYRHDPDRTAEAAGSSRDFLEEAFEPKRPGPVSQQLVNEAARRILATVDELHGGFGGAPKFPQAPVIGFLLRHNAASGDPVTGSEARRALRAMLRGGIYDQAGGGIMRYATDAAWLVPHFEKMLYDNALLLQNLGDACALEPDEEFAHAARQTAEFLHRDMRSGAGGYVSALSAETRGVEGATYTWLHEELADILSPEELALAETHLGVSEGGDWQGLNILTRQQGRTERADEVDAVLAKILKAREERPQPQRDEKVIVSWNAIAARGLVRAGFAIEDATLLDRGIGLARFLLQQARVEGRGLVHVLEDPSVAFVRLAEDSSHLAAACLAAYEAGGDVDLLEEARRLVDETRDAFVEDGAVHMTGRETELPARPLDERDSPTPSAASTIAETAVGVHRHTGEDDYLRLAERILSRYWALATQAPPFAAGALAAMIDYELET